MKYALIGAAGYIAPKHIQAIKDTGGQLIAAYDPSDSVGILDRHFPDCHFTTHLQKFERYVNDYADAVVICSPNDTHIGYVHKFWDKRVICEKPLGIRSLDLIGLPDVNVIMQLRLNPIIPALESWIAALIQAEGKVNISVEYWTYRGSWYHESWKGDDKKSGGLIFNIGIHILDILILLCGDFDHVDVLEHSHTGIECKLSNPCADVRLSLRIDRHETRRIIEINGEPVDLGWNFTNLHTKSYEMILDGKGFDVNDAYPAIELAEDINKKIKIN